MYYDIMDYHIKDQSIIVKGSKDYYIKYYIKYCEFDSHQKLIFLSHLLTHV